MKNKKLLIFVLVFVLFIGGAYALYTNLSASNSPAGQLATTPQSTSPEGSGEATEPPKTPAPDFTVYDQDGNPHKLSEFQGKPVILNFWSSNCGPCRSEMPDFQKAYETYGDKINFLMVNMTDNSWDTLESAQKFVEENGYTFPVLFDTELSAARTYGIRSLPTTYFIDAEGFLFAYQRGMIPPQLLQQGIDMLLK